jgi:hypothetical protein
VEQVFGDSGRMLYKGFGGVKKRIAFCTGCVKHQTSERILNAK